MPRRGHRRRDEHVPLRSAALTRTESEPDGEWVVRSVPGASSVRAYRCPGCDQEILPAVPHVVAWPAGEWGTVDDRRHWHAACWAARAHRRPGRRR
jgi:hypothetical protein